MEEIPSIFFRMQPQSPRKKIGCFILALGCLLPIFLSNCVRYQSEISPTPIDTPPTSATLRPLKTSTILPPETPMRTMTPTTMTGIPTWTTPIDVPENYAVILQVGTIDTRLGEPELPGELRLDTYPDAEAEYYLVQSTGTIHADWKNAIEDTGAELIGYVPNNSYIVRMTKSQWSDVKKMDLVQWVGLFQPAYKISPSIPMPLAGTSTITVLTFPGEDIDSIKIELQGWGGTIDAFSENEYGGKIRVTIDLRFIIPIAHMNAVMWIEPWIEPELTNP